MLRHEREPVPAVLEVRGNGALGEVQQVIPQLNEFLKGNDPVVLWLLEGQVLSKSELLTLNDICQRDSRFKVVVEMGGSRKLRWQAMSELIKS